MNVFKRRPFHETLAPKKTSSAGKNKRTGKVDFEPISGARTKKFIYMAELRKIIENRSKPIRRVNHFRPLLPNQTLCGTFKKTITYSFHISF